jgi:membrane protein involved in colicin uptake
MILALSLSWQAAMQPPTLPPPEELSVDLSNIAAAPKAVAPPAAPEPAPQPEPAPTPPPPAPEAVAEPEPLPPEPAPKPEPAHKPAAKPAAAKPKPEPEPVAAKAPAETAAPPKAKPKPAPKPEVDDDTRGRRRPEQAKLSSIIGQALGPAKPVAKPAPKLNDILAGAIGRPSPKPAKPAAAPDLPRGAPSPRNAEFAAQQAAGLAGAIRAQIIPCWNVPSGVEGGQTVTLRLRLGRDGRPLGLPEVTGGTGSAPAGVKRVFDDSARRAVLQCAPLKLPPELYDQWSDIELTFDPRTIR